MSSEFRPSSPADAAQIAALAQQVLGVAPDNPMFSSEHLRWKYWQPWSDGRVARSYVMARDGQIVAHVGVLPLQTRVGSDLFTLLHPFDWASVASSIGAGAALLRRVAALADGMIIVGGSTMTQRMAKPLGFRLGGDVARYAWHVPPGGDAAARARLATIDPGYQVRRVEAPLRPDQNATPSGWLRFGRSPARLSTLASCPAVEAELHVVSKDGTDLGEFQLVFAPFEARIAAFWCYSDLERDAAPLLRATRATAMAHGGVEEVVCMSNLVEECRALELAGFHPCPSVPMFVLAPRLPATTQLAFQMLDGDVAFLHNGARQHWL